MKKSFVVSLVKNGLLGGGLVVDDDGITYRTNKMTVPREYRNLVMRSEDIAEVTEGRLLFLPTVTIAMEDGKEYKFLVFFNSKSLLEAVTSMGIGG